MSRLRRVGVVGYGRLGRTLVRLLLKDDEVRAHMELAFVWNRTRSTLDPQPEDDFVIPKEVICEDLNECSTFQPDVIVEVAHPHISRDFASVFLGCADYVIGSPTALADDALFHHLTSLAASGPYGLYVPVGALWGADDISRMAMAKTLKALHIDMKFHPRALRLTGEAAERLTTVADRAIVVAEGSVRSLCAIAPNNVNTMACAALAATPALNFDTVQGTLRADTSAHAHVIVVTVMGPDGFVVKSERSNPAQPGAVSGAQTLTSFVISLRRSGGRGGGMHFC